MQNNSHHLSSLQNFKLRFTKIAELIFYGNYFYGVCIVSIILETATQLKLQLNGILFYLIAFTATVLFYNYPYARNINSHNTNLRTQWYFHNKKMVRLSQAIFTTILMVCILYLMFKEHEKIQNLNLGQWLLIVIFPITGALYYGSNYISRKYHLRQIGWLKPFIIGFVWAGIATADKSPII